MLSSFATAGFFTPSIEGDISITSYFVLTQNVIPNITNINLTYSNFSYLGEITVNDTDDNLFFYEYKWYVNQIVNESVSLNQTILIDEDYSNSSNVSYIPVAYGGTVDYSQNYLLYEDESILGLFRQYDDATDSFINPDYMCENNYFEFDLGFSTKSSLSFQFRTNGDNVFAINIPSANTSSIQVVEGINDVVYTNSFETDTFYNFKFFNIDHDSNTFELAFDDTYIGQFNFGEEVDCDTVDSQNVLTWWFSSGTTGVQDILMDNVLVKNTTTIVPNQFNLTYNDTLTGGDEVILSSRVYDGQNYSEWKNSSSVTYVDTIIPNLFINGISNNVSIDYLDLVNITTNTTATQELELYINSINRTSDLNTDILLNNGTYNVTSVALANTNYTRTQKTYFLTVSYTDAQLREQGGTGIGSDTVSETQSENSFYVSPQNISIIIQPGTKIDDTFLVTNNQSAIQGITVSVLNQEFVSLFNNSKTQYFGMNDEKVVYYDITIPADTVLDIYTQEIRVFNDKGEEYVINLNITVDSVFNVYMDRIFFSEVYKDDKIHVVSWMLYVLIILMVLVITTYRVMRK